MSRPAKRVRSDRSEPSLPISSEPAERTAARLASTTSPVHLAKAVDVNFRSLSTCNRCRLRKHRCDQRLPTCASCERVGAACTGYDPVTKSEIPRSYVYYLESRVGTLEAILDRQKIPYPLANADVSEVANMNSAGALTNSPMDLDGNRVHYARVEETTDMPSEAFDVTAGSAGILPTYVSLGGGQDPHACATGISFAHLAFSSVKGSGTAWSDESRAAVNPRSMLAGRIDSPKTRARTPFPDRTLGLELVNIYFHHSNPMYPVLHRIEFNKVFERACAAQNCTARESFILYIVFAIGAGIHLTGGEPDGDDEEAATEIYTSATETRRRRRQNQPEEYYATAITYLDSFLTLTSSQRRTSSLEELQVVLLLAAFALLRPAAPGLWYIVGIAARRAIDLGLYSDDLVIQMLNAEEYDPGQIKVKTDFCRRLWWCAYSFDRLVSTCVGRPCSFPDSIVATDFPSLLDDDYITVSSLGEHGTDLPHRSYKYVSHHYFHLRILQSEILEVLQAVQTHRSRAHNVRKRHHAERVDRPHFHHDAESHSPFPQGFPSLERWRDDVERRLEHWRDNVPKEAAWGVSFPTEYFDLNYWQTVLMLYPFHRQPKFPALSAECGPLTDNNCLGANEMPAEKEQYIYLRITEAGQAVLRLYRELHLRNLVNYTYLDTHQLFTAGSVFLSAIYLSPAARWTFSIADVDLTVLAATSVLSDLVEKCPHAAACRDAIQKMSRITLRRYRLSRTHNLADQCRLHSLGPRSSTAGSVPEREPGFPALSDSGTRSSQNCAAARPFPAHPCSSRTAELRRTRSAESCIDAFASCEQNTHTPYGAPAHRPPRTNAGVSLGSTQYPSSPPRTSLPQTMTVASGSDSGNTAAILQCRDSDAVDGSHFPGLEWNNEPLDFDPIAQVDLFDTFFFGDIAE